MKKLLIVLCACLLAGVCTFAAMPKSSEKQNGVSSGAGLVFVRVQDDCGKCLFTDTERKCGRCGGFMNSVPYSAKYVKGSDGKNYVQENFKCNKCSHGVTFRYR